MTKRTWTWEQIEQVMQQWDLATRWKLKGDLEALDKPILGETTASTEWSVAEKMDTEPNPLCHCASCEAARKEHEHWTWEQRDAIVLGEEDDCQDLLASDDAVDIASGAGDGLGGRGQTQHPPFLGWELTTPFKITPFPELLRCLQELEKRVQHLEADSHHGVSDRVVPAANLVWNLSTDPPNRCINLSTYLPWGETCGTCDRPPASLEANSHYSVTDRVVPAADVEWHLSGRYINPSTHLPWGEAFDKEDA